MFVFDDFDMLSPLLEAEMLLFVLGQALAVSVLVVATARWHGHFTFDHANAGVQKVHVHPVPRIGGVGIVLALGVGGSMFGAFPQIDREFGDLHEMLMLGALPALFAGLLEDLTKRVGVMPRLLATMASGTIFALLSGLWLARTEIGVLDFVLAHAVVGIAFTAFAVAGVANAINIIDGFNGLAGGVAVIILIAIAAMAASVGDPSVAQLALVGAAAIGGFLLLNFPRGMLFMGDGGAYFVGFYLAQLAVLLVMRNPDVSPWAMAAVFGYPLAETVFSILRRVRNNRHPGHPDRIHLHSLLHGRFVRRFVPARAPAYLRNALTAPLAWTLAFVPAVLAVQWPGDTGTQVAIVVGYCLIYSAVYARLARFRWCVRSTFGLPLARATATQDH